MKLEFQEVDKNKIRAVAPAVGETMGYLVYSRPPGKGPRWIITDASGHGITEKRTRRFAEKHLIDLFKDL